MALYASAGEGGNFKPIEEGTYVALCYGIVDLGDMYSEQFDKTSHKCKILWELDGEKITLEDGTEINRTVSKDYTLSLNEKSGLRKDLRAWRGREFTDEELKKFNVKNILGVPCQIQIVHQTKDGKTYANIAGIMSLPKGMQKPEGTNGKIYWDFEENEIEDAAWNAMPEFLTRRISESETYKYIVDGDKGHLTDRRITEIQEGNAYKARREFSQIEDSDEALPF